MTTLSPSPSQSLRLSHSAIPGFSEGMGEGRLLIVGSPLSTTNHILVQTFGRLQLPSDRALDEAEEVLQRTTKPWFKSLHFYPCQSCSFYIYSPKFHPHSSQLPLSQPQTSPTRKIHPQSKCNALESASTSSITGPTSSSSNPKLANSPTLALIGLSPPAPSWPPFPPPPTTAQI